MVVEISKHQLQPSWDGWMDDVARVREQLRFVASVANLTTKNRSPAACKRGWTPPKRPP